MEEDFGVCLGNVKSETPPWKCRGRVCPELGTWNPAERSGREATLWKQRPMWTAAEPREALKTIAVRPLVRRQERHKERGSGIGKGGEGRIRVKRPQRRNVVEGGKARSWRVLSWWQLVTEQTR